MKRSSKWVLGLAALALLGAGAWQGVASQKAKRATAAEAAARKTEAVIELAATDVVKAEPREIVRGLPISGSLKAVNSALVKARVAGELQGLTVREGDTVKAGQLIARVDPAETQSRLKQAQEQADSARAQIEIAQRQWANNKALVDQGFISKTALDTSWNNLVAAEANHKASLANVDVARKALDDTALRAPIGGVVAQRLAQPGERVGVDARVIEIVDLARLEVEATLTAADSMEVAVGQAAVLQIEGRTRPVAARVVRINPSAQAGSRSVLAYLAVEDGAGLRQGLFAQGTLATGKVSALAVPLAAVRTDRPAPYVQVVEDNKVAHKSVQPGARGDSAKETWIAVDGLAPGATVIKGHVGPLREGTTVKFTRPPSP
ncbi:efflux RND transporter periplasmic adaptor subunit [Ramlibacter sp.]|uniref:efflux RND transporter periplasmic adaptor subunit n=1 Tax=Ramlibacter sp. TaxID=1917967 RepID=UPI003D0D9ADB